MANLAQKFGEFVRLKREALGLNQEQLSIELYGKNRKGFISEIETANRSVSLATMEKILYFFETDFELIEN